MPATAALRIAPGRGVKDDRLPGSCYGFEPSKMGEVPVNSSLNAAVICLLLNPVISGQVLNLNEFWCFLKHFWTYLFLMRRPS